MLNLTKRILKFATETELENATLIAKKRNNIRIKLGQFHHNNAWKDPKYKDLYREWCRLGEQLTAFRKIVRYRRSQNLAAGVYQTTRKYTYANLVTGYFEASGNWYCLPKNSLLIWSSRNEIGENFFLWDGKIIKIRGMYLDGLELLDEDS